MESIEERTLFSHLAVKALEAREQAYAPYSRFRVGAALFTEEGEVVTGCNVENASYGCSICAERTAMVKAISMGHKRILYAAVAGGPDQGLTRFCPPCGLCRQFLREFSLPHQSKWILAESSTSYRVYDMEALLPESFGPDQLD